MVLERRGIVLSQKKGEDQLAPVFPYTTCWFSHDVAQYIAKTMTLSGINCYENNNRFSHEMSVMCATGISCHLLGLQPFAKLVAPL